MGLARSAREGLGSRMHPSLLHLDLLGGVPRRVAILNGTLFGCAFQATRFWQALVLGALVHGAMYWLTKQDPEWFEKTRRYWKTKRVYEV